MAQYDFGTIDPNVKTGTALAGDLNQWRDALHSGHAGAARPAYTQPGMLWVKQVSGTDWRLMLAAAAGDVEIGSVNPTTLVNGADAKYLAVSARGAANGVAPLDVTSKIPVINLSQSFGQCRFDCLGTTECRLVPYDGDLLTINGAARQIPQAGIAIANTAFPLNTTLYWVYAYWTGSAIALEASTTLSALSMTGGMRVKNGDQTRTLVGLVRKGGGGIFSNDLQFRYVLSWFNRRRLSMYANMPGGAFGSTGITALAPQLSWIMWGVDTVSMGGQCNFYNLGGAHWFALGAHMDGSVIINSHLTDVQPGGDGGGQGYGQASVQFDTQTGTPGQDNVHTFNLYGLVDAGAVQISSSGYISGSIFG